MSHVVMTSLRELPGKETALKQALLRLAEQVRLEPGNESFELFGEAGSSPVLVMLERYSDEHAFQEHLAQPHTRAFNDSLHDLAEGGKSNVTELTPLRSVRPAVPELRGIDHVGVTVPDLERAAEFFTKAFGAVILYDVVPRGASPMKGRETEQQLGLNAGAEITRMRLLRLGSSANIELFQAAHSDQKASAKLTDYGLQHLALYVDDMDRACASFTSAGGRLLSAPHALAAVEEGFGNAGVYGRTPWGMLVELIQLPSGIDYPDSCLLPRWRPAKLC